MKTASIADMKAHLSVYVREIQKSPIVVTRNGKPVAVLVAVTDEDELERLKMAHSPRLREIIDAGLEEIRRGEGIPHDEFWRQVEEERRGPQRKKKRVKQP